MLIDNDNTQVIGSVVLFIPVNVVYFSTFRRIEPMPRSSDNVVHEIFFLAGRSRLQISPALACPAHDTSRWTKNQPVSAHMKAAPLTPLTHIFTLCEHL